LIVFSFLFYVFYLPAQVAINNSASLPDSSAMLDIQNTTKGILLPRMTSMQRLTISNPAKALLVYQTDLDSGFYFNAGSAAVPKWVYFLSQASGWGIKGNTGINPANNFLGTLD